MIINGSPRAPKSNSKKYAEIFSGYHRGKTDYFNITKNNHQELCEKMADYPDLLIVFPLYADALPVTLLNFLKYLENHAPAKKPIISVLVNCGFLEYEQNAVAVRMMEYFCETNGYTVGSVLQIGSGEAILDTPFKFVVKRKIRKLAESIASRNYAKYYSTMPLTKKLFVLASTVYWTNYGRKFGISREKMQTMEIEK